MANSFELRPITADHFEQSLELDDNNSEFHFQFAFFLQNVLEKYELARIHYERSLDIDNNDAMSQIFAISIQSL